MASMPQPFKTAQIVYTRGRYLVTILDLSQDATDGQIISFICSFAYKTREDAYPMAQALAATYGCPISTLGEEP